MWADAEHIDIRQDGAYYKYTGTSYRDVFKNGLSLEKSMYPLIADYPKLSTSESRECIPVQYSCNTYDVYTNMENIYNEKPRVYKPKIVNKNVNKLAKKKRCAKHVEKCVFEKDDVETFDRLENEYKEEKWNLKYDKLAKEIMDDYYQNRIYDKYDFDDSYM
jgi:hypothetical protein